MFVVKLAGLGQSRYVTRGNTGRTARYDTREEARRIADKCPEGYQAKVVKYDDHRPARGVI